MIRKKVFIFLKLILESGLVSILDKFCIRGVNDLRINANSKEWTNLVVDLEQYNYKIHKKFYINKKRNEFYRKFSISEFNLYLKKIRVNFCL